MTAEQVKAAVPETELVKDLAVSKAMTFVRDNAKITEVDAPSEKKPAAKKPAAKKTASADGEKKPAAKKAPAKKAADGEAKPAAKKAPAKKPAAKKDAE